jgi:hypothetical protein
MDYPWVNLIWENYYNNGKLPDHRAKGSFWWRSILKLLTKFKGIAMVQAKQGSTVSLWHDMWEGKIREMEFPGLHSFITRSNIALGDANILENLHEIFQLPLSDEAFQQYTTLSAELDNLEGQQRQIFGPTFGAQIYFQITKLTYP